MGYAPVIDVGNITPSYTALLLHLYPPLVCRYNASTVKLIIIVWHYYFRFYLLALFCVDFVVGTYNVF